MSTYNLYVKSRLTIAVWKKRQLRIIQDLILITAKVYIVIYEDLYKMFLKRRPGIYSYSLVNGRILFEKDLLRIDQRIFVCLF